MPSKRKATVQETAEQPHKRVTRSSVHNPPAETQLKKLHPVLSRVTSSITSKVDPHLNTNKKNECLSTRTEPTQAVPRPTFLPDRLLPAHMHSYLEAQRTASLKAIQQMSETLYDENKNDSAYGLMQELLNGTVTRGEGNSCLLLGARGSGKTCLIEQCISSHADGLIIIRLSGWIQTSDRLAMREIAYQVSQQTTSFPTTLLHSDESLPEGEDFSDGKLSMEDLSSTVDDVPLPPVSHLPSLISHLPRMGRPVAVVLDAFDLFALHPRQSLLYCLLDTVQSCRASDSTHGMIVIGVTSRIDTIQLLEKRVKSRFSGRTVLINASRQLSRWKDIILGTLCKPVKGQDIHHGQEWEIMWKTAIDKLINNPDVSKIIGELFNVTKDMKTLHKLLTSLMVQLSPQSPFPTVTHFMSAAETQGVRLRFPHPSLFTYPSICLLVSSFHLGTGGQLTFTFEMLHETIHEQVRRSSSAPIQVNGGGIGMVRSTRSVLEKAFEALVAMKAFTPAIASNNLSPEFVKYRSCLDKEEVKKIVGKSGQIHLKKWLSKGPE